MSKVPAPIYKNVPIDSIEVLPQVRTHFEQARLLELSESLRQTGFLIHPITIRPVYRPTLNEAGEQVALLVEGEFRLVAGERRLAAARLADWEKVQVCIRHLTDEEASDIQLAENLQREDLTPMEEAVSFKISVDKKAILPFELAARLGKTLDYVERRLRLNQLVPEAQDLVHEQVLPTKVADLLTMLPATDQQKVLRGIIVESYGPGDEARRQRQRYCKPLSDVRWFLQQHVLNRLDTAPFDKTKPIPGVDAPSCQKCPLRTGANATLFGDMMEGERCLNGKCFRNKYDRHFANMAERFEQLEGREVPFVKGSPGADAPRTALEPYAVRIITEDNDPCPNAVPVCVLDADRPPHVERACLDRACSCRSGAGPLPREENGPATELIYEYSPAQRARALGRVRERAIPEFRRQVLAEKGGYFAVFKSLEQPMRALALLITQTLERQTVVEVFAQAAVPVLLENGQELVLPAHDSDMAAKTFRSHIVRHLGQLATGDVQYLVKKLMIASAAQDDDLAGVLLGGPLTPKEEEAVQIEAENRARDYSEQIAQQAVADEDGILRLGWGNRHRLGLDEPSDEDSAPDGVASSPSRMADQEVSVPAAPELQQI